MCLSRFGLGSITWRRASGLGCEPSSWERRSWFLGVSSARAQAPVRTARWISTRAGWRSSRTSRSPSPTIFWPSSVAARNRDLNEIATFFPERLTRAVLPTSPGPVETELKWIGNRSWTAPAARTTARERTRGHLVDGWSALLEHFSELDDVRFKVKGALFRRHRTHRGGGRRAHCRTRGDRLGAGGLLRRRPKPRGSARVAERASPGVGAQARRGRLAVHLVRDDRDAFHGGVGRSLLRGGRSRPGSGATLPLVRHAGERGLRLAGAQPPETSTGTGGWTSSSPRSAATTSS